MEARNVPVYCEATYLLFGEHNSLVREQKILYGINLPLDKREFPQQNLEELLAHHLPNLYPLICGRQVICDEWL